MKKSTIKRQVFVNAYKRIRLGKEEYVRQPRLMASFYFISILLWKITKSKSVWTGNADFLQVLSVDFSRVETVVLPAPVIVGIRNSQHFRPSVALRRGIAVVVLDSFCVLFRFRSLTAEQSQSLRVLIPAEEIGNEVAEHIAVPVHLHKLTAMGLGRFYGLQIALVVDTFNGTHFPLLFIQDQ